MLALSAGVSRKLPPSASSGANAIACSTPSTRPQRSRRSAATAARSVGVVDVELEHVGRLRQRWPPRSVMRLARPKPVSTTSAPASWAWRATSNAIDSRLTTPVMRSFLPCSREITSQGSRTLRSSKMRGPERTATIRAGCCGRSRAGTRHRVERRQRLDQAAARVARGDHLVDVALGGGDRGGQVLVGVRRARSASRAASGSSAAAIVAPVDDRRPPAWRPSRRAAPAARRTRSPRRGRASSSR